MKIAQSEIAAAKAMLNMLEGLALAIQQAANLIKDDKVGGPTISKTFERFKERIRTLPERYSNPRSSAERALDALWDMSFSLLSKNAKVLLGVFAWLPAGLLQFSSITYFSILTEGQIKFQLNCFFPQCKPSWMDLCNSASRMQSISTMTTDLLLLM